MRRTTKFLIGVAITAAIIVSVLLAIWGLEIWLEPVSTDLTPYAEYLLVDDAHVPKDGSVRITFLGTTTLLFDDGETKLMIDGFLTRSSFSQVMLGKIETDPMIVDAALENVGVESLEAVFVAHSHYDHALDVAYVCRKTGAKLYGSLSTLNVGRGGNLPDEQMVQLEAGKKYEIGGFTVTALKAKHSPPLMGLNDDHGEVIKQPLKQPARFREYKEGGAFDFLISHGTHGIIVNAAANYIEGARDTTAADVVFLSTGALALQPQEFQNAFYDQTIKKMQPELVIPLHWDNFFTPLSDNLGAMGDPAFEFLIERLREDSIRFGILQGYQGVTLFDDPDVPKKRLTTGSGDYP